MNILNIIRRTMSTSPKRIDLCYDVASPYSWIAFEVLQRYKKHWNVEINLVPVLLAGIFKGSQNVTPLLSSSTAKLHYIWTDFQRSADYFDVPMKRLKNPEELFTKGSMSPMRYLVAVDLLYPQYLNTASRAFWMLRWNKDRDFTAPEALEEVGVMVGMSKEEAKAVMEKMSSAEVKEKLKKNTNYALECGAFGVPAIIVENNGKKKLFFGSDRIPYLAREIGEEWKGPIPEKAKL